MSDRKPTIEFVHTGAKVHPSRILSNKQATNHYRWAQVVNELSRNETRVRYIYNDIKKLIAEGKQIVVISDRLNILDRLVAEMTAPPTVSFAIITGNTSPSLRTELMLRFSKKIHQVAV
jgi:superfamily II DNA or RNA helicase